MNEEISRNPQKDTTYATLNILTKFEECSRRLGSSHRKRVGIVAQGGIAIPRAGDSDAARGRHPTGRSPA